MTFKLYSGVDKLYRRPTFRFAITAGMKVQALPPEQRPFKQGNTRMVGGVWLNDRLFVKEFRSHRKPGQSITDAVRRLAKEFEDINGVLEPDPEILKSKRIDEKHPPPTGAKTVRAFLNCNHPNGTDTSPPGWNQHLRAQKLGAGGGFGVKRDPSLEEKNAGVDRENHPEPNNGPECVGDGKQATRWMNGSNGWGHYVIPCPNQQCPFSGPRGVCKVSSTINLFTKEGWAQYQSKGAETGAGMLGLFGTREDPGSLIREAAELGLPSLYGLPIVLDISAKTKGSGAVKWGGKMVQMTARRYPVVDINVVGSLVEFAHHQRQMLTGRTQIALPPAPVEEELIEADHDLLVAEAASAPAVRPGCEAPPAEVERSDEPEEEEPAEAEVSSPPPAKSEEIPELYRKIGVEFKTRLDQSEIKQALEEADLKSAGEQLDPETPWEDVKAVLDQALEDKAKEVMSQT